MDTTLRHDPAPPPLDLPAAPVVAPATDLMSHALVISGRPMIWTAFRSKATEEALALARLLRWCLDIPGTHIGIDPRGLAQIMRGIALQGEAPPLTPTDDELLALAGAPKEGGPSWPTDGPHFASHWVAMLNGLRRVAGTSGSWWLDDADRVWWFEATTASLLAYAREIDVLPDETEMLPIMRRHEFCLFGRLNSDDLLQQLHMLFTAAPEPSRSDALKQLAQFTSFVARSKDASALYWSWQLLNGSGVRESAINTPLLTLWNYWPRSRRFAPEPKAGDLWESSPLATGDMAVFLQGAWEHAETMFTLARDVHGVSFSEPEVDRVTCLAPVMFVASPALPPMQPEDYLARNGRSILPLVRTCLGSDDARSQGTACGVLEGELLTLRREIKYQNQVMPRYLVLPAASAALPSREAEDDLNRIAQILQYIEYDTASAARRLVSDIEPLADRQSIWAGSLRDLSALLDEGLDLIQSVSPSDLQRIYERCCTFSLALGRLQARFARSSSGVNTLVRTFQGEIAASEEYLQGRLTVTSVTGLGLQDLLPALLSAFPYQRTRRLLEETKNQTDALVDGMERLRQLTETVLREAERLGKARLAIMSGLLTGLVPALALMIALPGFIPDAQLRRDTYPQWLEGRLGLTALAVGFQSVALIMLVVSLVVLGLYAMARLSARPGVLSPYVAKAQQFTKAVAEAEANCREARLREHIDENDLSGWAAVAANDLAAAPLLDALWKDVYQANERLSWPRRLHRLAFSSKAERLQADTWINRADHLRNGLLLFDLAPETMPLPGCLCVFRYKSQEMLTRGMVSDWYFHSSLLTAGMPIPESRHLDLWLSSRINKERIERMSVAEFHAALGAHGVSADPHRRTPEAWTGLLGGA
jgi:hypothetical protein